MSKKIIRHTDIISIVGDILKVRATNVANGELAIVEKDNGEESLARVIELYEDVVSLQVFSGGTGLSTSSSVKFLGKLVNTIYSNNILGRVFNGSGETMDNGPSLKKEPTIDTDGPTVNPMMRIMPKKMIRTDVPMIDVFNTLVESQKIPIFSIAGEPYNKLLARIGIQTDADIVVFAGLGLIFDDYHFFKKTFEDAGVSSRTIMYVNQASDPIVERLLIPDMALAVAEKFAVEQDKKVLVLMTDMTAYADALKEVGIAMEHIPSNRGYTGDLYSQLARRYEKACDYKGAGSVTIISVTTMPGDDVTHPVPDNTGYITEGQFYLHNGMIDPFGSLSRLKQNVIGKTTREDHSQVMNTMIRLYAESVEAKKKQAMAFELSDFDEKCIKFGEDFKNKFMDVNVAMSLEKSLDKGWELMAQHFNQEELLMKESLINKYYPKTEIK
ncbi:MAG: V-type ATP synthase subunit B [Alphaproteobacteria bacterium]|jgi:V/A-type H+-transporting ATPase subunit B|nr:V-type ATP synthase subunit B [Alphaproteobacteria bacterium]